MTWIPEVPINPQPLTRLMEQLRQPVTLEGCSDAELEAERQRRIERCEQRVKDAIKLVEAAGYTVVKGGAG